jgi:predicted PurR-regulated permease PerM
MKEPWLRTEGEKVEQPREIWEKIGYLTEAVNTMRDILKTGISDLKNEIEKGIQAQKDWVSQHDSQERARINDIYDKINQNRLDVVDLRNRLEVVEKASCLDTGDLEKRVKAIEDKPALEALRREQEVKQKTFSMILTAIVTALITGAGALILTLLGGK